MLSEFNESKHYFSMNKNISIPIYVESRYKVNRKKIKETVKRILNDRGINHAVEVSVAIVGARKMRALNNKYRQIDRETNVLSFPQAEGHSMPVNPDVSFLGDIVICYPVIIDEASRFNKYVDSWICELVEHGLLHLLGENHL